jgi:hypothetical protein
MNKISIFYKVLVVMFFMVSVTSCTTDDDIIEPDQDDVETTGDDAEDETDDNEIIGDDTDQDTLSTYSNFVWKNWYLSVPIDKGDGDATSLFYETIVNYTLTPEQLMYFYKNADDSTYTMFTKFTGYTTSGLKGLDDGSYCRTELREFWQGVQSTSDNWYMSAGTTHVLESTLQVAYCGGIGKTYVAQIHGKESPTFGTSDSPATVKVLWDNDDLELEYYTKPVSGAWTSDDITKTVIGTVNNSVFTIRLKVEDGKLYYALYCEDESIDDDYELLYDYLSNGYDYSNYFKTGNYFKYNKDYTESAQVKLIQVKTEHY